MSRVGYVRRGLRGREALLGRSQLDLVLFLVGFDRLKFVAFFCFSKGPDAPAANARQVPDNVRPDHREEYPFLKARALMVVFTFLILYIKCPGVFFYRTPVCLEKKKICLNSVHLMRWAHESMTWRKTLLTWWPRLVWRRPRRHQRSRRRAKDHHEGEEKRSTPVEFLCSGRFPNQLYFLSVPQGQKWCEVKVLYRWLLIWCEMLFLNIYI